MGTHPSSPAFVSREGHDQGIAGRSLLSILEEVPEYAGSIHVMQAFGKDLPFLFKVLSIDQPLSIQSHPDKELAGKLHKEDPLNYPDDNHKPEMAIALTAFEALCSFRPWNEILEILSMFPQIREIVTEPIYQLMIQANTHEAQKESLRQCFSRILCSDAEVVSQTLFSLETEMESLHLNHKSHLVSQLQHLFKKVYSFYPKDVGCICALLLNYIKLKPGEAIFLKANEPHAYLSGDCMECMAKSDNVIRAGFTPKFKDVKQLYASLSYESISVSELVIQPIDHLDGITSTYLTPVQEFAVDRIYFNSDGALCNQFVFPAKHGGSLLIVLKGKFHVDGLKIKAKAGGVYFIPAMLTLTVVSFESELLCFRAFVNM